MVLLTERMNTLKKCIIAEKHSRCEHPAHLDPGSSDEEELPVLIVSVPIFLLIDAPLTSDTFIGLSRDPSFHNPPVHQDSGPIDIHIPTLPVVLAPSIKPTPSHPVAPQSGLSPAMWSALIAKSQAGDLAIMASPPSFPSFPEVSTEMSPLAKVFTVEAAPFSLDPDPSALPDCLVQMAINHVFIPLSMLTTVALNNIETNQDVKYKWIT